MTKDSDRSVNGWEAVEDEPVPFQPRGRIRGTTGRSQLYAASGRALPVTYRRSWMARRIAAGAFAFTLGWTVTLVVVRWLWGGV